MLATMKEHVLMFLELLVLDGVFFVYLTVFATIKENVLLFL